MGIVLKPQQYRVTTAILFIISLAFCAAMIGLVASYWKQRVDTCHDLNIDNTTDCKQRTHDYLFDGYRNITNKFFVDCFNLAINLIGLGIISYAYQKVPKTAQHILVLILLALSTWSLACTIKSIDEEDKLDKQVLQRQTSVLIQLETGEAAVASAQVSVKAYQTQLTSLQASKTSLEPTATALQQKQNSGQTLSQSEQNALAQYNGLLTGIASTNGAITLFNKAISSGQASFPVALDATASLQRLHDKYQNYRKSCMALVLINFVSLFLIAMFNIFSFPGELNKVESAKLDQVITTNGFENVALKKAPSSGIEMNAQNVM